MSVNTRTMLLTVFGLGLLRPAPGTWGSLPPVGLALIFVWLFWPHLWMIDAALVLIGLLFAIACARFGDEAERTFGRKDPSQVVADEVAGQAMPLLFLPWRAPVDAASWWWNVALAATALITFRFFDIVKVPPARQAQRLSGGWGVLVDDLIAGAFALIATQTVARYALPVFL